MDMSQFPSYKVGKKCTEHVAEATSVSYAVQQTIFFVRLMNYFVTVALRYLLNELVKNKLFFSSIGLLASFYFHSLNLTTKEKQQQQIFDQQNKHNIRKWVEKEIRENVQ